jgi:shikimate dehydrogenase
MGNAYGLVGESLGHSFSKKYFTDYFTEHKIDACYQNYEVCPADLGHFLNTTLCPNFNVTIPHKQAALHCCSAVDEIAESVGAANCIKRRNGNWYGTNTDALALVHVIENLQLQANTRAIILGTGGASLAAQYACRQLGIAFVVVSRRQNIGTISYADLNETIMARYALVINATPLGMYPHLHTCAPISAATIKAHHILLDLVYNPDQTLLMKRFIAHGARAENGLAMLHLQAKLSWDFWQAV